MGRQRKSTWWQIQVQAGQYLTILSTFLQYCRSFPGRQMYNLFIYNMLNIGTFIAILFTS